MESFSNYSYPNFNSYWMWQNQYQGNMNNGYYYPMQYYYPMFQGAPQNTGTTTTATGTTTTTTNTTSTAAPATTASASDAIKSDSKKAYIAINKKSPSDTSANKLSIYETTPEKLEEFKQKSKKDRTSRIIVGLTLIGLTAFGLIKYGPGKAFNFISEGIKKMVKNPSPICEEIIDFGTILGLTYGTIMPGLAIAASDRKQKKLAEEYFPDNTLVQKSYKQMKKDKKNA